jgi:hypothetical protein
MQPIPATTAERRERYVAAAEPPLSPLPAECGSAVQAVHSSDLRDADGQDETTGTVTPVSSRASQAHPLLRLRWVRRLLRFVGFRTRGPVPTCRGVTRLGQPCRGPAMANGLCRMHGGSRIGLVVEKTQNVLVRLFGRGLNAAGPVSRP